MEVLIDLFLSGITIFSFIFLLIKYLFLFILLLEPITLGPDRGEKASLVLIQIELFSFSHKLRRDSIQKRIELPQHIHTNTQFININKQLKLLLNSNYYIVINSSYSIELNLVYLKKKKREFSLFFLLEISLKSLKKKKFFLYFFILFIIVHKVT